jgi:hypothetical protein
MFFEIHGSKEFSELRAGGVRYLGKRHFSKFGGGRRVFSLLGLLGGSSCCCLVLHCPAHMWSTCVEDRHMQRVVLLVRYFAKL